MKHLKYTFEAPETLENRPATYATFKIYLQHSDETLET
jgi:hypothetical protein